MGINVNSNIHSIAKKRNPQEDDSTYREYRKKWESNPVNYLVSDFPLFIDIEVTNNCNLKCKFCATTYFNSEVKRGYIEYDLVKRIIDEGKNNGLYGVKFNDRGEPLLHKDILKMVKYAKEAGLVDVYFNTNAMLLNEEVQLGIIDAGLDRISISVEGTDKEFYEKNRVGANFDRVVENIKNLQDLKKKKGVLKPFLRVQSVRLDEIERNKEQYSSFWGQIADEVCLIDFKEEKEESNRLKDFQSNWACHQLFQRMVVWWDGTILPCNEDDRGKLSLGNVKNITIKQAWNSVYLNLLREKHKCGKAHEVASCNGCYLRDSEIKKLLIKRGELK